MKIPDRNLALWAVIDELTRRIDEVEQGIGLTPDLYVFNRDQLVERLNQQNEKLSGLLKINDELMATGLVRGERLVKIENAAKGIKMKVTQDNLQEPESPVAKANPAMSKEEQGKFGEKGGRGKKTLVTQDNQGLKSETPVSKSVMKQIRRAHSGLSDEEFEKAKPANVEVRRQRQIKAAKLIMDGYYDHEVAKMIGVGATTIRNWKKRKSFHDEMAKHGERKPHPLKPNQIKAAKMRAAGKTLREIAEELGMTAGGVLRWTKDQRFQDEMAKHGAGDRTKNAFRIGRRPETGD